LLEEAYHEVLEKLFAMFEERTAGMSSHDALKAIITLYLSQSSAVSDVDLCPLAMLGLKRTSDDVRSIALLVMRDSFVSLRPISAKWISRILDRLLLPSAAPWWELLRWQASLLMERQASES